LTLLITGGAGFIGAATAALFERSGHDVVVLDDLSNGRAERIRGIPLVVGDVRDTRLVQQVMTGADAVLHLAARSSVPWSFADPVGCHAVNDEGTAAVLEAAWQAGVPRVVLASSSAVYGHRCPAREPDPLDPRSPYASSKAAMEAQGRVYGHRGLAVTVLRYFNVYGPDACGTSDGAVVARFLAALQQSDPLPIEGTGRQGRDFVHVDDVARANLAALAAAPGTYNVGTGVSTSISELAQRFCDLAGVGLRVRHLPAREVELERSRADPELATRRLGFTARVDLQTGLAGLLGSSGRESNLDGVG